MNKFRVHHIMCTNLYKGYGYSGPFCENMTKMVSWLNENQDEPLLLVTHPDEICKKCPNLVDGRYCVDITNHVQKKDEKLLEPLKLNGNKTYTYRQLKGQRKYLKKAVVTASGMIRAYADTKILIGNNITFVKNQEKKRLLLTVIFF